MTETEFLAAHQSGAHLRDLDLHGFTLAGAKLARISGTGLNLRAANLTESDLSNAVLRMCAFDSASAASSCFDSARLEDSTAIAADFSHATFRNAHLTETSFSRAALNDAIFDAAEGDGIDFRGADLRSASLQSVRFDETDFRGADLRGADLSQGRFQAADFRGALLDGARLEGADFQGATFDEGEAPPRPAPATETKDDPAAALRVLTDLFAMLLPATAAADPAAAMNHVRELIDGVVEGAGYSEEQRRAVQGYLDSLTRPGGFDKQRLEQLISSLASESGEPPQELKPWLEPFLKTPPKDPKA